MWYLYTMEYYSDIKKISFAAIWIDLEIIILSEANHIYILYIYIYIHHFDVYLKLNDTTLQIKIKNRI